MLKGKINSLEDEVKKEIKKIKEENIKSKEEFKNEINEIKNENIQLKNDNTNLKMEINKIREENNNLTEKLNKINMIIMKKSVILKENEFNMIESAIKNRLNKEIKEIKKLYQASIDGDETINFHQKCDNTPNTLVFIETAGNRRFGGFTTQIWNSCAFRDNKNAFLFSLDKQKIYKYKNDGYAIYCDIEHGPCFGKDVILAYSGEQFMKRNYILEYVLQMNHMNIMEIKEHYQIAELQNIYMQLIISFPSYF